jgi:hypothetical protein
VTISKKTREIVRQKYNGKCAYTGTDLKDDWQVDHVKPIIRNLNGKAGAMFEKDHCIENMVPCQKIVNHYKGNLDLETFRSWYLGELHLRLKKLPKNCKTEKSARKKAYLLEVAALFGITEDTPFSGEFYFEMAELTHTAPH